MSSCILDIDKIQFKNIDCMMGKKVNHDKSSANRTRKDYGKLINIYRTLTRSEGFPTRPPQKPDMPAKAVF